MKCPSRYVLLFMLALVFAFAGAVDRADAQPVTNPTAVVFTPSTDHAQLTGYEVGYFATGASAPTQSIVRTLAQLTPSGTDFSLVFPRLLFGAFDVKLRACAAATCSAWVAADKSVVVTPLPPTAPRVQ